VPAAELNPSALARLPSYRIDADGRSRLRWPLWPAPLFALRNSGALTIFFSDGPDETHVERVYLQATRDADRPSKIASREALAKRRAYAQHLKNGRRLPKSPGFPVPSRHLGLHPCQCCARASLACNFHRGRPRSLSHIRGCPLDDKGFAGRSQVSVLDTLPIIACTSVTSFSESPVGFHRAKPRSFWRYLLGIASPRIFKISAPV
jgi:hypothetical protein